MTRGESLNISQTGLGVWTGRVWAGNLGEQIFYRNIKSVFKFSLAWTLWVGPKGCIKNLWILGSAIRHQGLKYIHIFPIILLS